MINRNNINFNKIRYIELLKKEEIFKNQKINFYKENPEEYEELSSYKIILENQIYYNQKDQYISLIKKYLKENAGEKTFVWDFFDIFRKNNEDVKILEKDILEQGIKILTNFRIDSKSTGFSDFITQIITLCESVTFSSEEPSRITSDQFRDSIENIFFKIQKYLDE